MPEIHGLIKPRASFLVLTVIPLFRGNVRTDRRCGPEFLLPNGQPSECDPNGDNPCCSQWGYCGPGADHCSCSSCKDYRTPEIIGTWEAGSSRRFEKAPFKRGPFPFQPRKISKGGSASTAGAARSSLSRGRRIPRSAIPTRQTFAAPSGAFAGATTNTARVPNASTTKTKE